MALSMPPPAPALSGCKDAWIADLSAYYGLMLELAQRGYPSAERAKGRHLELLVRVASEAQSVPQLQGALALAAQYKGTEEELSAIASALASSLAVAPPDPRALAAASSLATEVERLTAVLNGRGLDASALLAAYRGYLANQKPCAETKAAEQRLREPAPVNEMRQSLAALQGAPLGSAEREELFAAALRRFESWPEAPPAEVRALFHEKALSCRMLLESADSGSQLDRGLNACVRFFRDTPAKNEYPAEWLIRFERLRQPFAPGGVRNTSSAVEAIRRSGDALMNLLLDMGEPL